MNSEKTCHAFSEDILKDYDATKLARLLKNKDISQKEVVEASIKRSDLVSSILNAVAFDCYAQALEKSGQKSAFGFFSGVPTFVKDNIPVAGLPTGYGTAAFSPKMETENDPYAKQFLNQGFAILGKSALPEFGFNASTEPAHDHPTRNPWNTDFTTGGSSGGAAALVASGVVTIAHANDGGGSIRIPAACCGLVGLKPSRGRHVTSKHAKSLPINIISQGVVSRSVRDTAYFHYEAENYYQNKSLPPIGLVEGPNDKRLRIGFIIDSITGSATDKNTSLAVQDTAKLLAKLGHNVEEIPLTVNPSFIEDFSLYWGMLSFFTQKAGRFVLDPNFDSAKVDGLTKGLSAMFAKKFYKTPAFMRRLRKTYDYYEQLMRNYDLIMTPVLAKTPVRIGHLSPDVPFDELYSRLIEYVSFTPLANASGIPAISLPVGITQDNLPISIQFSAGHGQERTLLEIAFELEQTKPWRKIHNL